MNKILKYGLAILLIGFGIVLVISITSNSTIFGINEENYTLTEESYASDDFDSINFDFDNRHVYITESPDDLIHVKFYLHEKDELTYSDSSPELNIEISRKWYFSIFTFDIFTNKDYFKVLLSLPTSTTVENLDINTSNGELELNITNVFDSINLSTSNGRIDLVNFTVKDLVANSSNGDVMVDEISAINSINLKTSNGAIDLSKVTAPDIKANTSNGRITAEDIISEDISLDTSNGRIYLVVIGLKDDYRVTLSTSNGDEIYDGLKVASGTINTDGIYRISLDSSNGDVEVAFVE
jgi:DUF4097 and DUF4098 domain-containing protein YvlB